MHTRKEESQDRAIVRIAAHLPDLIVYGDFSPKLPSVDYFDGVLMFVDISGKRRGNSFMWMNTHSLIAGGGVSFLSLCAITADIPMKKTMEEGYPVYLALSSSLTQHVQSWANL